MTKRLVLCNETKRFTSKRSGTRQSETKSTNYQRNIAHFVSLRFVSLHASWQIVAAFMATSKCAVSTRSAPLYSKKLEGSVVKCVIR